MSLTTRLSAFFLAALAAVLIGFSAVLYAAIHAYLFRQLDERVRSAQAILAAAAETHPNDVEWEPDQRILPLGRESSADRLRWMIHDDRGRRVDQSRNLSESDWAAGLSPGPGSRLPARLEDGRGQAWRIDQHLLLPESPSRGPAPPAGHHRGGPRGDHAGGQRYASLLITVFAPLDPIHQVLGNLILVLAVTSTAIWVVFAFLGRWLCKRALAPLSAMVESASGLDATDIGWSLQLAGTGDELDDLGRAFNDLLGRLQIAYERQRRFSGEASHQLRTPLTALIGQVEVALRRDRPEAEYRRVLGLVMGQAFNLTQIVESLLFLARAEGEAQPPGTGPLDLLRWVESFLEERHHHPRSADIRLVADDGQPLPVRAHPHLLGQLLENLLDNACKYSPPRTIISVRAGRSENRAVIAVEDSGPGIEPEDLPQIFRPFFRSARMRQTGRPGVGLGLAVARRIAEAFGGTISAESKAGGSIFRVVLPLAATPDDRSRP